MFGSKNNLFIKTTGMRIIITLLLVSLAIYGVSQSNSQGVTIRSFTELYATGDAAVESSAVQTTDPVPVVPGNQMSTTAGLSYYSNRGDFDADFPGLPVEGFENGNIPALTVVALVSDHLDELTNDPYFSPGDILPGIQIGASGTEAPSIAGLGVGIAGNLSKIVLPNFFKDEEIITFNPPVTAVGFDVHDFTGGTLCNIDILDAIGNPLGSTTSGSSSAGVFFGVCSDIPIGKIILDSQTGTGEGADNIAFGNAPPKTPVPLSGWAVYMGIFLIFAISALRFRKLF